MYLKVLLMILWLKFMVCKPRRFRVARKLCNIYALLFTLQLYKIIYITKAAAPRIFIR